jgi:sugar lactone lactonase YvrE
VHRTIVLATALFGASACVSAAARESRLVSTIVPRIEGSGDVSIGPDGNVYLADFGVSLPRAGGQRIYRIAPDGGSIDTLNAEFGGASGNEFGADGLLYQSDIARGEAWRVAMDGRRMKLADSLRGPVGITRGPNERTYVTECLANAITRINDDGTTQRIAEGPPLACPNGLTHAPDGNLYAVNFRDGALVRIVPATGVTSVVAMVPGGGAGHLAWANERFYVASFRGHRIYSVTMAGRICHIAGSGEPGNADGALLSATFFRPNGLAVSADGNTLYTNTVTAVVARDDPSLHPNAVRRVDGLLGLLDCPPDRLVTSR